jgi:hypothetical protein
MPATSAAVSDGKEKHSLEVVNDPGFKLECLAQFPGIDDPGTIGQFAALSLHRTGNG